MITTISGAEQWYARYSDGRRIKVVVWAVVNRDRAEYVVGFRSSSEHAAELIAVDRTPDNEIDLDFQGYEWL